METASIPRLDWEEFLAQFDWKQGEHIALIGPTGLGKSHLTREILDRRDYLVICVTKVRDPIWTKQKGFNVSSVWPTKGPDKRVILWPRPRNGFQQIFSKKKVRIGEDFRARQKREFRAFLDDVFSRGGYCVCLDELFYITDFLGLKDEVKLLWQQGRSLGISLVCGTQRPAFVPLELYDQSTHLFFFKDQDERNLKRIGGIGWLNSKSIMSQVASLNIHDVLYINSRTGDMLVTRAPERR
jgi:hypothetical protein